MVKLLNDNRTYNFVILTPQNAGEESFEESMSKQYFTYVATNFKSTVLYTGITNNLNRRMYEHKNGLVEGFTKKYKVNKLIFYEIFINPEDAIRAEKKIKGWTRKKKMDLIKIKNPEFEDLLNFS